MSKIVTQFDLDYVSLGLQIAAQLPAELNHTVVRRLSNFHFFFFSRWQRHAAGGGPTQNRKKERRERRKNLTYSIRNLIDVGVGPQRSSFIYG
jgi:hypothetical protein